MIKEKNKMKTNKDQLAALHQAMLANNDQENADKILDLYDKFEKEELIISFSGHFSAGKSSIINTLLGKDILPKSPIPTSANIVKMTSGKGWARVFFNHADTIEYKEPYDLEMIKEYSMDKDAIKKIEISTAEPIIPNGSAIIDTPGIDAADDADRLMTEGALHLVDVLFYVMDYNHVQSEVNLYFLQSLQENNIPFYLIINQIDKHNERELSFASFAESITQTFSQWNIRPKDIFFTSLLDFSLEVNQFREVKDTLFLMMKDESDKYFNIDASVQQVINKHKKFLKNQYEELLADVTDDEVLESQLVEIKHLEETISQLQEEPELLEKEFHRELKNTLKNAYLMPKELRDKAERYLESEQPGFKVGLFGSKKKTEEEKNERLNAFVTSLQGVMEASVQWKLRDKFLTINRNYAITEVDLQNTINHLTINYDTEDIKKLIKPGAKVNGDYVLNYTNYVASDMKQKFKLTALALHT
ncbi:dynamin family protein, partial [Ralstonia pickettii]|nr:dynamin family protein [Ralstonia pickettii]